MRDRPGASFRYIGASVLVERLGTSTFPFVHGSVRLRQDDGKQA